MTLQNIVIDTVSSKSNLDSFVKFPHLVYKDYPDWVAPLSFDEMKKLNRCKHPFFKRADAEFFMAHLNGEPVGRIAAILDHKYEFPDGEKGDTAYWGYFETVNDAAVANKLFEAANEWARTKGCKRIIGPLSPSANDLAGLLIDNFHEPLVFMMSYNPEYYVNLVESFGHAKLTDLYAWLIPHAELPERTRNFAKKYLSRLEKEGINFRPIDMKDWNNELEKARVLFNNFEKVNPIYTPMTEEEFSYVANDMKMIIDPEFVFFAEHQGKPVGVSMTFPDMNALFKPARGKLLSFVPRLLKYRLWRGLTSKSLIKQVRVTSMGLLEDYRGKGIDQIFYYLTGLAAEKRGIETAEFSWVDQDNLKMNNIARKFDKSMELYKTYRVYQHDL